MGESNAFNEPQANLDFMMNRNHFINLINKVTFRNVSVSALEYHRHPCSYYIHDSIPFPLILKNHEKHKEFVCRFVFPWQSDKVKGGYEVMTELCGTFYLNEIHSEPT